MGLPHPVWVQSHSSSQLWDSRLGCVWGASPGSVHKPLVQCCLRLEKMKKQDEERKKKNPPKSRVCACWHECTHTHVMTWPFFPVSTLCICTFEIKETRQSLIAFAASILILHINHYSPFSPQSSLSAEHRLSLLTSPFPCGAEDPRELRMLSDQRPVIPFVVQTILNITEILIL